MERTISRRFRVKPDHAFADLILLGLLLTASTTTAAEWAPKDPNAEQTTVAFSRAWTAAQRDVRDFADLQRAADAGGRIESFELQASFPYVTYVWSGSGGQGRMRACPYQTGSFSAVVSPSDSSFDIMLNSFGAFVCPACTPPVKARGGRPS